jgi:lipid-A-disaccharide synthase
MFLAGEASGDTLAAELAVALRHELLACDTVYSPDPQPLRTGLGPRFFGAGGPRLQAAGVELAFDMTRHAVVGWTGPLKHFFTFTRLFYHLARLARQRQPDAIVCVDYGGFNRRFAQAIRRYSRTRQDWFHAWRPKIVQYVSPQVWASREGRAYQIARDYDLLLTIFPFEKEWYAKRVPQFRVEFVGHPALDRFRQAARTSSAPAGSTAPPSLLLLPGSRSSELQRHLPVLLRALGPIRQACPGLTVRIVLSSPAMADQARSLGDLSGVELRIGGLPEALARTTLAIASTGTVTVECACAGVPAVTLYRAPWANYLLARAVVRVDSATMPNLLAGEELYPEFLQTAATPGNIARAAIDLLRNEGRRAQIRSRLHAIVASLGGPGASRRAAQAVARLMDTRT